MFGVVLFVVLLIGLFAIGLFAKMWIVALCGAALFILSWRTRHKTDGLAAFLLLLCLMLGVFIAMVVWIPTHWLQVTEFFSHAPQEIADFFRRYVLR